MDTTPWEVYDLLWRMYGKRFTQQTWEHGVHWLLVQGIRIAVPRLPASSGIVHPSMMENLSTIPMSEQGSHSASAPATVRVSSTAERDLHPTVTTAQIFTDAGPPFTTMTAEAGQLGSPMSVNAGPEGPLSALKADPANAQDSDDKVHQQTHDHTTNSNPVTQSQTQIESRVHPEASQPATMPAPPFDDDLFLNLGGPHAPSLRLPPPSWAFSGSRKHQPFDDTTQRFGPSIAGVIKISNINFAITFAEIELILPKDTPLLIAHEQGYPIHFAIDRTSGKHVSCFVELPSIADAASAVCTVTNEIANGQRGRRGHRSVAVALSSQEELMRTMFLKAKRVSFDNNGVPTIHEPRPGDTDAPFRGYMTMEEINCFVQYAQSPNRSPFTARVPARIYQSMISTLYKYPWKSNTTYTIATRNDIFHSYIQQLDVLVYKVSLPQPSAAIKNYDPALSPQRRPSTETKEVGLDLKLLLDLFFAGVNCPGFSPRQKAKIIQIADSYGRGLQLPCPNITSVWPFECLNFRAGISEDELTNWLNIMQVGFTSLELEGIPFKYDQYCNMTRDLESGLLYMVWNERGRTSSFRYGCKFEYEIAMACIDRGWEIYVAGLRDLYPHLTADEDDAYQAKRQPSTTINRSPLRYDDGQVSFPTPMRKGPSEYAIEASPAGSSLVTDARGTPERYGAQSMGASDMEGQSEAGLYASYIHQPSPIKPRGTNMKRSTSIQSIPEDPQAESAAELEHDTQAVVRLPPVAEDSPPGKGKDRATPIQHTGDALGDYDSMQDQLRNITNTMQSYGARLNAESRPFTPGIPWTEEHGVDPHQFQAPGRRHKENWRGRGGRRF